MIEKTFNNRNRLFSAWVHVAHGMFSCNEDYTDHANAHGYA